MIATEISPIEGIEIKHNGVMASPAATLIALCFESRTKTHFTHLHTLSYSKHKALEDYYNSIIPLTDTFAESYQGRYNLIVAYPDARINSASEVNVGLQVVTMLRDWIDQNRKLCGEFSELQNVIDGIVDLCNSTIYKLTNLA